MTASRQLLMRRSTLDDLPPTPPLPPEHKLRQATADDADGLAALLTAAFPERPWTPDRARAALLDAPDVDATYVVTYGGVPVATASARLPPDDFPGSGYVHWVGADPAHRGRGLGRAVTLATLHRFRELGCRDAVLETDPPRLPAIRLYLALGFRPEPHDPQDEARWRSVLAALGADPNTLLPGHGNSP